MGHTCLSTPLSGGMIGSHDHVGDVRQGALPRSGGPMKSVLLVGAALNFYGALIIPASMFVRIPNSFPSLKRGETINPSDYVLFRLFTAGAAATFGSLYLYLFVHPEHVVPFLIFGAALKYWAFLASAIAYARYQLPKRTFILFGCANLLVAVLFTLYLIVGDW